MEDRQTLIDWLDDHGQSNTLGVLPFTGFIVDDIAAGFLVATDTDVACLDFFISNPSSDPDKRSAGLNEIVSSLLKEAKEQNYKYVKIATNVQAAATRAKQCGFLEVGNYRTFFKEV